MSYLFAFSYYLWGSHGEGNDSPLQYSYLENPVDRGAWWAAVHGVSQYRTRLKWLSMHACIGEGNGNPPQCSCLEDPRDGGAWWAAIYGVGQSQTRLKWLSSSSSSEPWGSVCLIFCDCDFHSVRGLWKLPDGRDWLWGNLGLVLMGEAMLSKSWIQFPVDGRGCVSSLLFALRPNYGGGNGSNSGLLLKDLCLRHCIRCPWPCNRALLTHASTADSETQQWP